MPKGTFPTQFRSDYWEFWDNSKALITLIMSVRATTPRSKPCSSTTQTRWTWCVRALLITSARGESMWHVISCLGSVVLEVVYRGLVEMFSVKSWAVRGNHVWSEARWQPLKSVAENVPISCLPFPWRQWWSTIYDKSYVQITYHYVIG